MLSKLNDQDPRVRRTRQLIETAFNDLLAEKNFDSITVQDVTEKAQINRATFYAHFEDKYALLDHSIRQMFRQEIEKRVLDACHYTPDNLRMLILAVCEFLSQLNTTCAQSQKQFSPLVEKQIKAQLYELLLVWLRKMDIPVSAEMPATAATWAIYGLASYWVGSKNRPTLDAYVDEALPLVAVNLNQFAPQPA
jgi:AcrR family transcriptional regulator